MENEIKVGEYIRANGGYIGKVIKIREKDRDCDTYYVCDTVMASGFYENIVKHSPNLLNLICEGDYVNGKEVIEVFSDSVFVLAYNIKSADNIEQIYINQIKKIVTHEQFKSISYKVTKM